MISRVLLGIVVLLAGVALALVGFGVALAAPPGDFCDRKPNHPKCQTTTTPTTGATTITPPPASKVIHAFVVVPASYTSNVTPEQAMATARLWLGNVGDAACLGNTGCSIEGWLKHELNRYFDYDLTLHRSAYTATQINLPNPLDSCGQMNGGGPWGATQTLLRAERGYNVGGFERTIVLLIGAGGWAGHHPDIGYALVGDWGVAMQNGKQPLCDFTGATGFPSRGFGHEFLGMMGAFVNNAYYPVFTGDPLDAQHEQNLLTRSGEWLHP